VFCLFLEKCEKLKKKGKKAGQEKTSNKENNA